MELTIALALSILGSVISVSTFVLNRKDKAIKDKEELDKESSNQMLIDYRLTKVEEKIDKVLNILEGYEEVVKRQIKEAMERHIELYHRKDK